MRELLPFSPELLSGGVAIGCELSGDEKWKHMDDCCRSMALELLEDSICGYTKYTRQEHFVELYRAKVRLALVPIWLLCTRWRGRSHFFYYEWPVRQVFRRYADQHLAGGAEVFGDACGADGDHYGGELSDSVRRRRAL